MTDLVAGAATDVGRVRTNNQDSFLMARPLFAVADGMGGHAAGEVASATALEGLEQAFGAGEERSAAQLETAMKAANQAVWAAAEGNVEYRGMGTTLTAVALTAAGAGPERLAVANVGDSRTYRLRDGDLEQVTADHSLVAELVAEGQITEGQAETHPQRHVLTRALGVAPDVEIDVVELEPVAGDRYLLCSDGLIREVSDERMASVLRRLTDPTEAARELVAEARDNGGSDNITVVVVDVVGDRPASDETAAIDVAALAEDGDGKGGQRATGAAPEPAGPAPAAAGKRDRRARRAAKPPKRRALTVRVVVFVTLIVVVLVVAVAGTAWYARDSWFVGLDQQRLVIYKGRPGGVLWWKPTIQSSTTATVESVEAYHLPALRAGVQEPSLAAARQYVARLQAEERSAG